MRYPAFFNNFSALFRRSGGIPARVAGWAGGSRGAARFPSLGRRGASPGFTLFEVIAVLIIMGILAAVAISRGTISQEVNVKVEVDTLKSHLRYAQSLAMNEISPIRWGIQINSSSYSLVKYYDNSEQTHTFNLPGESSATHNFKSGVSAGSNIVLFDEWGSPFDESGNPVSSDVNLTVGGESITITADTGFIP
jgi:MSHA pilin protein MshC